ncbi:hypothetical protein FisN_14Hh095 [Fistulifera solaris]|uniref:Plastid lipid-associated protein/fibrillin conserved domain-containing protein n=1 Tax=Fistulifera solaris TaxID=1519565 RepID=A0A1Z5K8A7_FISSO|nr:hypothetical protein FisN_14Hh095 [Fistulifera solaris]|eukprot:GAX22479.1 hypothetical protein FisN_14Hh095 [Fistulifera solaris]
MRALAWVVCAIVLSQQSTAFSSRPCFSRVETRIFATADDDGNEVLKKAAALREEANRLEESLKANRPAKGSNIRPQPKAPPMTSYKSMKDSTWTLTYRFADRPESRDVTSPSERNLYNGKLTVIFLNDGYSEVVRHESTNVKVQKVWGWDVERSSDDDNEYLLFSVDFVLPSIGKERFYFQARKSVDGIGNISLAEGTITVKQDVVDSKASRWSLFSPRGILAEFRAVGEFIGKPSTAF